MTKGDVSKLSKSQKRMVVFIMESDKKQASCNDIRKHIHGDTPTQTNKYAVWRSLDNLRKRKLAHNEINQNGIWWTLTADGRRVGRSLLVGNSEAVVRRQFKKVREPKIRDDALDALIEIKAGGLWLTPNGPPTWALYLKHRFGVSVRTVNRMIAKRRQAEG